MRGAAAKEGLPPRFDDLHDMTPAQERNADSDEMSSLSEGHLRDISDGWTIVRIRPKHNIFLSHSGAQKDFVEQLCIDLERATLSPFFDKRSNCLPKGEEFAHRIFAAAQECEVAVVVITDEYFYRTKWPMLELVAVAQAPGCKILPLFYGLTCKKFKEQKRQERWFKKWNEWAQSDCRIDVDTWKKALRKLGGMNGMPYAKALGEVCYRKKVVKEMCRMMLLSSQDEIIDVDECTSQGNQNPAQCSCADAGRFQRWSQSQRWSPILLKWSVIICFPFWFAALLKLVMVKIVILVVLLYIGLFRIIVPLVGPCFCWNQKLEPPDSKCWLSLE